MFKIAPTFFAVLIALSSISCKEKVETTKPQLGKITESIYASVYVKPENLYAAYSSKIGIIKKVSVEVDDEVKAGQELMQIVSSDQQLRLENAALALDKAKQDKSGTLNQLNTISYEIEKTKKTLSLDSANYFRQKNLWDKDIGSLSQLENAELKYNLTQKQLDILQEKYAQTAYSLENTYKQAKNSLKVQQVFNQEYTIESKINGKVYKVFKEEGELISQQEPFAEIASTDSFIIEMSIDEVDIARVGLNDSVLISLDAFPEEVFMAVITKILPVKDNATQTFTVEAEFIEKPSILYYGLTGEANIITAKKDKVLTIPLPYLIDGNKVMVNNKLVTVKVGIQNLEFAEILSGIDTSTVLQKQAE